MRTLFRLKPTVRFLDDFYVFDTETGVRKGNKITWKLDGRPESFIFGVIHGLNFTKVIHSRQEFIDEFKDPRYKDKIIFAHNAEYDLTVLYDNIYFFDPEAIFNGKFISAKNGNCMFADSLNIYRTKVSVIGEMIGMIKLGMSGGDYKKSDWSDPKQKARDINGCIRDCEIIYEALWRIFEKAGDIKITQASLSMDYFRRFFMEFDIKHNENNTFFFDSYYGGRCEAFRIGKVKGYVRDVNSMYPWGMLEATFPDPEHMKVADRVTVKRLPMYLKNFEGLVYCTVEHKDTWLGYLPVKKDGKLLFPTGTFSGCWNFNELRFAIEQKVVKIKKVERVVYSKPMKSPFISYVTSLYNERISTDNEFLIYVIKIFMNSLYGKFAQRIQENFVYIKDMDKQIDMIRAYQLEGTFIKLVPFNDVRKDAFLVTANADMKMMNHSIPSFASYITSFCRVKLLKELIKTGKKNTLYCDTDSLVAAGKNNYQDEKQLGGWKLEKKVVTGIYGLKNYTYKNTDKNKKDYDVEYHRIKGIPKSATKTDKHKYRYVNLVKTRESLRRGLDPGKQIERIKELKGSYNKRVVLKNGLTKPIKL